MDQNLIVFEFFVYFISIRAKRILKKNWSKKSKLSENDPYSIFFCTYNTVYIEEYIDEYRPVYGYI